MIAEDERELPQQHRRIDEHAERDEEEARQDVAQRANLGVRLVAVLALRQDQAAEKRAERHRDAEERTGPGCPDAREEYRQRKRFAAPAAATSRKTTGRTNRLTTATTPIAAAPSRALPGRRRAASARQDRHEQQQNDDAKILKEHDADDQPSVGRIELVQVPSSLSTMAVLESATKRPAKSPSRHVGSTGIASDEDEDDAAVSAIWSVPPMRTLRQIRRISVRENSSPTVKSSSTMPISASISTSSCVLTIPMPAGPATGAGDDERHDRGNVDAAQNEDEDQCDRVGQYQFGQGCVPRHDSV